MTSRRLAPLLALVIALVPLTPSCSKRGSTEVAETPDAAVVQITRGLADYKPEVLWQAMPASYQKEVTQLVHDAAAKMDGELWNESFGVLQKVAQVLREKKTFILEHPMVASKLGDKTDVDAGWDAFVGMFEVLLNSELSDLDQLKTLDIESFMAGTGSKVMRQVGDAAALAPDGKWKEGLANLRKTKATLVSREGDTARVRVAVPGEKEKEEDWVRVEGRWIPKTLADGWTKSVQDWRKKIDAMSADQFAANKQTTLMQLSMANGVLDALLKAKTAEQFNAGLGPVMGLAMGAAMSRSASAQTGSSFPPSGAGGMPVPSPGTAPSYDSGVEVTDNTVAGTTVELSNDNPTGELTMRDKLVPADTFAEADLHGIVPVDQAGDHIGRKMMVVTRDGTDGTFRLTAVEGDRLVFERNLVSGTVSVEFGSDEIESLQLIENR